MGDFKAQEAQENKKVAPVEEAEKAGNIVDTEYVDSRASTFQLIQIQTAANDYVKRSRINQLQSKSDEFIGLSRVEQQKGEDILQGKFTQGSLPKFSKTQPIQLELDKSSIASQETKRNVTPDEIEKVRKIKDKSLEEIKKETGLTLEQITTAKARLFGDVQLFDAGADGAPIRQANPWDKWFVSELTEENRELVEAAKEQIPTPQQIFTKAAIADHLGKFANGAHAFIDPGTSGKIKGTIEDARFKGWGVDANFVAPLDEAEKLHNKANAENGIVTLEKELGIGKYVWSRTEWNPRKEMVRWTIPKPLDFKLENNEDFLTMATGNETGALVNEWVAGGFTLGGMTEAVVKALPREQLLKSLSKKEITDETVVYKNTPDNIGEKGPVT